MKCPRCGAPSDYLYANNGGKGQYQCKVCACLFNKKNQYAKEAVLKCPHCSKTLEKIKERKDFPVFKCKNNDCPYYKKKLQGMSKKEKKQFEKDPQSFKVRYIFRQFQIDYQPLAKHSPKKPKSGFVQASCVTAHIGAHFNLPCKLWLIGSENSCTDEGCSWCTHLSPEYIELRKQRSTSAQTYRANCLTFCLADPLPASAKRTVDKPNQSMV